MRAFVFGLLATAWTARECSRYDVVKSTEPWKFHLAGCTSVRLRLIGDEGARALAKALKTNSALTGLALGHNSIGAEGARALAEALKASASARSKLN